MIEIVLEASDFPFWSSSFFWFCYAIRLSLSFQFLLSRVIWQMIVLLEQENYIYIPKASCDRCPVTSTFYYLWLSTWHSQLDAPKDIIKCTWTGQFDVWLSLLQYIFLLSTVSKLGMTVVLAVWRLSCSITCAFYEYYVDMYIERCLCGICGYQDTCMFLMFIRENFYRSGTGSIMLI